MIRHVPSRQIAKNGAGNFYLLNSLLLRRHHYLAVSDKVMAFCRFHKWTEARRPRPALRTPGMKRGFVIWRAKQISQRGRMPSFRRFGEQCNVRVATGRMIAN